MAIDYHRGNKWERNIVKDESAPAFFSERAVNILTILFGVFFGSILLSLNLRKLETKKGILWIVPFGIFYTFLQIEVLSIFPSNLLYTYLLNTGGAYLLNVIFWNKYIGENTKYRERKIWVPLIIGVLITALLILLQIYGSII